MKDNIVLVTMLTGESLICESLKETTDGSVLVLSKPHAVGIVSGPNGPALSLAPWPRFSAEMDEVEVRDEHVVCITKPEENIAEGYNVQILGGISTPKKPGLLLPG